VRVFLDPAKVADWPEINSWYLKLRPKKEQDSVLLLAQIREAGPEILGWQQVQIRPQFLGKRRRGRRHLEVSYSSCGLCAKEAVREICRAAALVGRDLTVTAAALLDLMERMYQEQIVFQETGGTHGVALATPDGAFFLLAEDVGRHNAMDKVIGRALLQRRDLSRMVALLSGRISFEMALKAICAGIPILAAVSAPTSLALNLAQELNLTLAGFARNQRLNIYTHPHRLTGLAEKSKKMRPTAKEGDSSLRLPDPWVFP
jgi:formate dehydrogenase accessory protein FdhD